MKTNKKTLLNRFLKEREGGMAIEFAMVVPVLATMFLATVDLSGSGFTKSKLSSALRYSGQYVVNGGTDLGVAETIFARSYGGQYDSFSSRSSCSCAKSRAALEDGSANQATANDETLVLSSNDTSLPQCSLNCGSEPRIQYLDFTAVVFSNAILGQDRRLEERVSVRIR